MTSPSFTVAPALTAFLSSGDLGMTRMMAPISPTPDEARAELCALLPSIARGDRLALTSLYQRTSAKLMGIIVRILDNRSEAEEVLQDVYVSVWRHAGRFDQNRASPITWLAVLARNRAIDRLRKRKLPVAPLDAAGDPASDDANALDVLEQAQDRHRLADCLAKLEGVSRRAIESAYLDGRTYSEVAMNEKVPLGTMKSRMRRALLRLRECLES